MWKDPLEAWRPPACRQRVVLLAGREKDAAVELELAVFEEGSVFSAIHAELLRQVEAHPGGLLAIEHQGWWHDDAAWVRYHWAGQLPVEPAQERMTEVKERKVARVRKRRR